MMLAGIVLTISFILTSLTLAQVASLEREAAAQTQSAIVSEWRFLHERLGSNLKTAISADTSAAAFKDSILPTVQATFRSVMSEKGYDLTIRPAGDATTFAATGYEAKLLSGANYNAYSWDGRVYFNEAAPTPHDDGILWDASCPDTSAPAGGCIGGVYVYVRLTDGTTSLEESILFAVNQ